MQELDVLACRNRQAVADHLAPSIEHGPKNPPNANRSVFQIFQITCVSKRRTRVYVDLSEGGIQLECQMSYFLRTLDGMGYPLHFHKLRVQDARGGIPGCRGNRRRERC